MNRVLLLLLLASPALAKGPGLDSAVHRLDVPWTTWRAGEEIEVRATLDLEGACERWLDAMNPGWTTGMDDCLDALAWQVDGGGGFSAYLVPAEGAAGYGTYLVGSFTPWWGAGGQPVYRATFALPDHWPAGAWSVSPSFGPLGDEADPELAASPLLNGGLTILGSGWEDAEQPRIVALQAREQAGPDGLVGLRVWVEDDASPAVIARAALRQAGVFGEIPGLDHATVAFACHPCPSATGVLTLCEADRPARVGGTWEAPTPGLWELQWVEARDAAGRWNIAAATVKGVTVEVSGAPSDGWGPVVTLAGEPTEAPGGCLVGGQDPPLGGNPVPVEGVGAAGLGGAPEARGQRSEADRAADDPPQRGAGGRGRPSTSGETRAAIGTADGPMSQAPGGDEGNGQSEAGSPAGCATAEQGSPSLLTGLAALAGVLALRRQAA